MIIEKRELYKTVRPENGKLLKDTEGIYNILYLPLKMEDEKISQKFTEIDENDFEIKVEADSGIYSKLAIRRTCRELNL